MDRKKLVPILIVLTIMACLLACYFTIGGLLLLNGSSGTIEQYDYAKFTYSSLCFLIACLSIFNPVTAKYKIIFITAFFLILAGDLFLVLLPTLLQATDKMNYLLIGAGIFALCHILLSIRNLQGISYDRTLPAIITAIPILSITIIIFWLLGEVLTQKGILIPSIIYIGILDLSLWSAWGAARRSQFPKKNAWLIIIGMSCFYACDMLVGVKTTFSGTTLLIMQNLVWSFYAIAIMTLAWSGHNLQNREP